ncbi:AfsR/SARP family transcriptional regulator [Streptomyces sp. WMMC905]|uniref:AfsR/SARP family transcriptional regulator n=1 Tax=Streptomyces sp. WMMC905 TaxID=3404123 RepID=UPI003B93C4DD
MRYRVLGTTQALHPDGTVLSVGGARLRALLTVLALDASRPVPVGTLVREVWGAEPPADAPAALQALVGRLRRLLGADAVVSVVGGYRLAVPPDDIDVHRFHRLADEGCRELARGDPRTALRLLEEALALWRDPALADLPDRGAESARLETRRREARRALLAAALDLGHTARALPELDALCAEHPLDESLQALRLRALRDTGRPAEALAAYEEVRRDLAERLGSDPGPELRALYSALLDPDPGPGADPGSPGPRERPPDSRSRPWPAGPQGNLRARLNSFVGRDADLHTLRRDLASGRMVTLLGPGGSGKTRLAQEVAEIAGEPARDGVWLAELAPVDDPESVPEAVLTALGGRETVLYGAGAEEMRAAADRPETAVDRLVEHCGRRRMLIVLDNCEHVVGAAADLAEEVLSRCPRLTVLATSREPLGVVGEVVRPVEPLPEPAALRLLADRGGAARPGFRVEDDLRSCAEICRRLDGLPLAIELAAARLRMLTPRQIADRLDDRFPLLASGNRTVLPRQQTLRAVVDWSWELLAAAERRVLAALSVFSGGCDLEAAEAVCGPDALEVVGSLVDKSLVVAAPSSDGKMRYRLLETVAEYAGERLTESGRRAAARRAHLVHYRELARTTDPLLRGPQQLLAVGRLEREYENLRGALRHAVAERDEQEALSLALSLSWYWQMRDLRAEARGWCAAVMALGPDPFGGPARRATPVWEACTASPPPMTGEVLIEARRGVHLTHLSCLDTEFDLWHRPEARDKLSAIAATYEPGMPQTCRHPGRLWFFALLLGGDLDRLRAVLDASVRTARHAPGFRWELAGGLQMRANVLVQRAEWLEAAVRDADESLELYRRLGDAWGTAEALAARGEVHERRGRHLLAAADYGAAAVYAERLGAHAQEAVLGARLGSALVDSGDETQAERGESILRDVIERTAGTAHNTALPAARLFLAGRLAFTGRTTEAREHLALLRKEFSITHFAVFDAFILASEALVDTVEERYEEALVRIARALERTRDPMAGVLASQVRSAYLSIAALALVGVDGGSRARDGARCLGAAAELVSGASCVTAMERGCRDRAERRAREVLGARAYEAARAEGAGLGPEEAAALIG